MKKTLSLLIVLIILIISFSCRTYHRCPAYGKLNKPVITEKSV